MIPLPANVRKLDATEPIYAGDYVMSFCMPDRVLLIASTKCMTRFPGEVVYRPLPELEDDND